MLKRALTGALLIARASHAQRVESAVDVAALAVRYADTVSTSAGTVTPRANADWESGVIDVTATYSQFTAGGWSAQGSVAGSKFTPMFRNFYGELTGSAGGSSHNDGTRTGQFIASGRLHFPRARSELFLGAGGGRTWDGMTGRNLLLGEAGLAVGSELRSALLTVSPARVNDSTTYADTQGSVSWTTAGMQFGALAGFRVGDQPTALGSKNRAWVSLTALRPVHSQFAVIASAGSYPIDPTQGFPGGKFISLGLRMSRPRRATLVSPAQGTSDSAHTAAATDPQVLLAGFTATRVTLDSVTLSVNAPGAQTVEINADFTDWLPVRLSPQPDKAGWWAATLPLTAGNYQMNVRLDGREWTVPPGILSMRDEFGGTVGLLVLR